LAADADTRLTRLPPITDTAAGSEERVALIRAKLDQCCTLFDFVVDPLAQLQSKEVKRGQYSLSFIKYSY